MDLFLSFVKDNVYVPPLPTTLHQFKTRITEACANTDQEILHNVWQEVEYRFDAARASSGAHIELINDKLLLIKLFQLVFQSVRVL
jgi:hypothetical protein